MPEEELNLFELAPCLMAKAAQVLRRSCGATEPNPQSEATCFTIDQMTLAVNPLPQTLPVLLTERNRNPVCKFAEVTQASIADFTHSGSTHMSKTARKENGFGAKIRHEHEYGLQEELPVADIDPAIELIPNFSKLSYLIEFELLMQRHAGVVR
jgi:hypothetical protein